MSLLLSDVDASNPSSSDVIVHQSHLNFTDSFNGTENLSKNIFGVSDDMMRWLFLTVIIITVLICLTICLTACICICLKRRRHQSKRSENKDSLLPEGSIRSSGIKTSKRDTTNFSTVNGKQGPATQQTTIHATKSAPNAFYYDNLDDIPFIDDSRPTSVVDITQV